MKIKSLKNKKAVFGLTAVQQFFTIILGIALLAYVIIIIMGTLNSNTILTKLSATAVNESVANPVGASSHVTAVNLDDGICGTFTKIYNGTGGISIGLGNYTQTGCTFTNTTSQAPYSSTLLISYPYTYNSNAQTNSKAILSNVSSGVTSFFSAINPVYAILAVLVIILVLVVLVRVVQSPNSQKPQI